MQIHQIYSDIIYLLELWKQLGSEVLLTADLFHRVQPGDQDQVSEDRERGDQDRFSEDRELNIRRGALETETWSLKTGSGTLKTRRGSLKTGTGSLKIGTGSL
jgi:hypothetical protein